MYDLISFLHCLSPEEAYLQSPKSQPRALRRGFGVPLNWDFCNSGQYGLQTCRVYVPFLCELFHTHNSYNDFLVFDIRFFYIWFCGLIFRDPIRSQFECKGLLLILHQVSLSFSLSLTLTLVSL